MFGLFRDPIKRGVGSAMQEAFSPGGSISEALRKSLEPFRRELEELRRYKRRHGWHTIDKAPDWIKDGRPVLLAQRGDILFGAYFGDGGYWDADIEHGGSPIEPPPDHFFVLPKVPAAPDGVEQRGSTSTPGAQAEGPTSGSAPNE